MGEHQFPERHELNSQKFRKALSGKANEGRAMARASVLEWLELQIKESAAKFQDTDYPPILEEGYRQGLEDARKLIEATDPLHIWEVDCRRGHQQWSLTLGKYTTKCYLDGEPILKVLAADSVSGLLLRYVVDEDGRPIAGSGGGLLTEVVQGNVRLKTETG